MSSSKKKMGVFAACASIFVAMISMTTTAVLAYIIADYAAQGVATSTILLIMTATPLVGLICSFVVGPIALKVSKKVLIVISQVITIVLGVIFVFFGGSCPYWVMIVCGGLTGIVSGILANIPNSIVSELSDSREEAAKYQGWTNATMQAGAMIMSLVGGALGALKWQNAYILYFIAVPILFIVLFMIPSDKPSERPKPAYANASGSKPKKGLGMIPAITYLRCLCYALIFVVVYIFSVNISSYIITENALGTSLHTGISTALMTLSGVIAGILYSKYVNKLGKWFMPVMVLLVVLGFAACAFITGSLVGAFVGAILIGFCKVSMVPYCIGKVTKGVPGYMIPVCISLLMGCMNLGMFVSTYIIEPLCSLCFATGVTVNNKFLMGFFVSIVVLILTIILFTVVKDKEDVKKAA